MTKQPFTPTSTPLQTPTAQNSPQINTRPSETNQMQPLLNSIEENLPLINTVAPLRTKKIQELPRGNSPNSKAKEPTHSWGNVEDSPLQISKKAKEPTHSWGNVEEDSPHQKISTGTNTPIRTKNMQVLTRDEMLDQMTEMLAVLVPALHKYEPASKS